MDSNERIRTKISKGYQVVVPSELRKRYDISIGDEVLWEISNNGVSVQLHKKPSLSNIVGLGHSHRRSSSVELKKKIQKGEL
jgi:bifunctional DNA-binding transcriptional regulator/antitoxin component of YhaV-PrlF toxin-antitoxin module